LGGAGPRGSLTRHTGRVRMDMAECGQRPPWLSLVLSFLFHSLATVFSMVLTVVVPVWAELSRRLPTFWVIDPEPSTVLPAREPDVLVRLVKIPSSPTALPPFGTDSVNPSRQPPSGAAAWNRRSPMPWCMPLK
jgi:hypothetical protein